MNQEFDLVYHGNFGYDSIEDMPPFERRYHYERLVKVKNEEKEAYEDAVEKAKNKQNRTSNPPNKGQRKQMKRNKRKSRKK